MIRPDRQTSSGCGERAIAGASLALALVLPAFGQTTTRVSVDSGGIEGDASSYQPSISADGRYVAFRSFATNLDGPGTYGTWDVYIYHRVARTTEIVSIGSGGTRADHFSFDPSVSADGRYVAFASYATNLVAGDTNGSSDVFVRDRQAGTTERVSVSTSGGQGQNNSYWPSISADGRYVAFEGNTDDLVIGDTNGWPDIFVHDRQTGSTEIMSLSSGGVYGNSRSTYPAISADGRYVAFLSSSVNLVSGDTNMSNDIFVRDRQSGTTVRVSVTSGGLQVNGDSIQPSISADGRFVAFCSWAPNLVSGDTGGFGDIFVRDRQQSTTVRVSVDSGGVQGNGHSGWQSISADGRFVAFQTLATNLDSGDTNMAYDVFVHDRLSGTTQRVSVDSGGFQGNSHSSQYGPPSLSANGRYVVFESDATNLVVADTNAAADIFVRDLQPWFESFCFGDGIDTSHTTPCPCGNFGAPQRGCAHSFDAGGAKLTATGTLVADDIRLDSSFEPATSFTLFMQQDAAGDFVFHDGVLCAGGTLIRLRGRNAIVGAASFPNPLWDSSITLSQRGGVFPGQGVRRYYSAWYRNASTSFCPPATANVTNGLYVDW